MNKIESKSHSFLPYINRASDFIKYVESPEAQALTLDMLTRIKEADLLIGMDSKLHPITPKGVLIDYGIIRTDDARANSFRQTIVINNDRIMKANDRDLASQMVRTAYVADQSYDQRYNSRYTNIYSEAIEFEDRWRQSAGLAPNLGDWELRLKNILGSARYYSDIGFKDWKKTLELNYKFENQENKARITRLTESPNDFVIRRSFLLPLLHLEATDQFGEEYITRWDQDKRTGHIAQRLLDMTLAPSRSVQ